jgi:hypothetical protein
VSRATARSITAALAIALALPACLRQDTNTGVIIRESPVTTVSPTAVPSGGALALGQAGRTKTDNIVTVKEFRRGIPSGKPGVTLVAADASLCRAQDTTGPTVFTPEAFELEMGDGTRRPAEASGPTKPNLRTQRIEPNKCGSGWVHFQVGANDTPAFVVLKGSSGLRWKV